MSNNGIAYFQKSSPAEIQRYDLESKNWLNPISLSDIPRTFWVDDTNLYIGFDRKAVRLGLDGTGEELIANTATAVRNIFSMGDFIYVTDSEYNDYHFFGYRKSSLSFVSKKNYWDRPGDDIEVDEENLVVYFHSSGVSPSDVIRVQFDAEGHAGDLLESPYHGDYPAGQRQFIFPGGQRLAEDSGIVYNTGDLSYNGSLQGSFNDLVFYEDAIPILLRGNRIESFNEYLLYQGDFQLGQPSENLAILDDEIFVFYEDVQAADGIGVEVVNIDQIELPTPGAPIDPNGLAYDVDAAFVDNNGVLLLLNKSLFSLFRYSPSERRYLDSIALLSSPEIVDFASESNRLYIAYPTGTINYIDLDESELTETPFVGAPQKPHGMKAIENFLMVADGSGAWNTHYVYSGTDGSLIDQEDWNRYSREYAWNSKFRRLFMFRDGTSPNDLEWEEIGVDGMIGESGDSPFHSSSGIQIPIRVSQDENYVLLGSGRFYDASTLEHVDNLSNNIIDALWLESELFTIKDTRDPNNYEGPESITSTIIQSWTSNNSIVEEVALPGNPVRMFAKDGNLLVVSSINGYPRVYELTPSLEMIFASELGSGVDDVLSVSLLSDTELGLSWHPQLLAGNFVDIEVFDAANGEWKVHGTVDVSDGAYAISGLEAGDLLDVRLASTTKYQTKVVNGGYSQTNRLYHRWQGSPDELRLERKNNETNDWDIVSIFPDGSYQSEYEFNDIPPFELYELRLSSFTETLFDITDELESLESTAYFNWLRDVRIEDGFVLTVTDSETNVESDLMTFSNDVFSYAINDVALDFSPLVYRAYALVSDPQVLSTDAEPSSETRFDTILQITVDRNVTWPDQYGEENPIRIEGFRAERGEWRTLDELSPGESSYQYRSQVFSFMGENSVQFDQYRFSEVVEADWNVYAVGLETTVYTDLTWEEYISSEELIIQRKESPTSDWADVIGSSNGYGHNWSINENTNVANEYRVHKIVSNQPDVYGFATAIVPGETTSSLVVLSNPGNLGIASGGGTFTDGSAALISARDLGLFTFDHWVGEGVENVNSSQTSIVVGGNLTVTAVYSLNSPELRVYHESLENVSVKFDTMIGVVFQLQTSADGRTWEDSGTAIEGDGSEKKVMLDKVNESVLVRLQSRVN